MDIFRVTRHVAGGLILAMLLSACGGRNDELGALQTTPGTPSADTTGASGGPDDTHAPDASDASNTQGTSDASRPDATQAPGTSTTSDPTPITLTESRTAEGGAHYIASSDHEV